MKKIWKCKIGEVETGTRLIGADAPMRKAIQEAYEKITGKEADFCFSGWDAKLNEEEQEIFNNEKKTKLL